VTVANFNGCDDGTFGHLFTVITNATLSSISMPAPTGNNCTIIAWLALYVIVPQYKYDIVVITRVQGKAEYECYDIIHHTSKSSITGLYHDQISAVLGTRFILQEKINTL